MPWSANIKQLFSITVCIVSWCAVLSKTSDYCTPVDWTSNCEAVDCLWCTSGTRMFKSAMSLHIWFWLWSRMSAVTVFLLNYQTECCQWLPSFLRTVPNKSGMHVQSLTEFPIISLCSSQLLWFTSLFCNLLRPVFCRCCTCHLLQPSSHMVMLPWTQWRH